VDNRKSFSEEEQAGPDGVEKTTHPGQNNDPSRKAEVYPICPKFTMARRDFALP
jgi:hypothetical protein